MKSIINIFVSALCVNFVVSELPYRAAVVSSVEEISQYSKAIREAAEKKLDILVLASSEVTNGGLGDHDKAIKMLSSSAKDHAIYLVAHLLDKTRCENQDEVFRSVLAFDREGVIVATQRKPLASESNCTSTNHEAVFATDFGETFSLVMEDEQSCLLGENNNYAHFEKLLFKENFTNQESAQSAIPLQEIQYEHRIKEDKFKIYQKVTVSVKDGKNIINFGGDYTKNIQTVIPGNFEQNPEDNGGDFQELFDYLWIRIRVMIFIVSIYVLEMM